MTRVGINGFGRMGRLALRAGWDRADLQFVHVNEVAGDAATGAHLLEFDSVHGRWPVAVEGSGDRLLIDGEEVGWSGAAGPGEVDWAGAGVELVLECSGRFRTDRLAGALLGSGRAQGRRRRPGQGRGRAERRGGRQRRARTTSPTHDILTAASCTTNCLAPVVKVIHEGIGIRHGVDHHPARHDQHPDRRRRPAQGPAPRARREPLADPHHHRLGDRDRADLPRAARQAERRSRCACRC